MSTKHIRQSEWKQKIFRNLVVSCRQYVVVIGFRWNVRCSLSCYVCVCISVMRLMILVSNENSSNDIEHIADMRNAILKYPFTKIGEPMKMFNDRSQVWADWMGISIPQYDLPLDSEEKKK